MNKKQLKRNIVLGILFFLPVTFLLFLYPAKHNYNPLEVVKQEVLDIDNLTSAETDNILLKDHITILGFLGSDPESLYTQASNLKELAYDKFKGFKKFQVVMMVAGDAKEEAQRLKLELMKHSELKYWHFVFANEADTRRLFSSLRTSLRLDSKVSTSSVYIIDKDLNQRGRLDDRSDNELAKNVQAYPLTAYNCSEVAVLKNKMSEDMRVLFTEYREKRKGDFDSSSRRENEIKPRDEKN